VSGAVTLTNTTSQSVALSNFRLDSSTPDWGSFAIEGDKLPSSIAPGEHVTLQLRAFARNFARRDHQGPTGAFHSGTSAVVFEANGEPQRLATRFLAVPAWWPTLLGTAMAALVAWLFGLILWAVGPRPVLPGSSSKPRRFRDQWLWLVVAVAALPWASGLCFDWNLVATPADLAQCGDGRGGFSPGITSSASLLLAIAALAAATRWRAQQTSRDLYLLGFALALLAPATQVASVDLGSVMAHQVEGWFAIRQPVAFTLSLLSGAGLLSSAPLGPRLRTCVYLAVASCIGSIFCGGFTQGVLEGRLLPAVVLASGALAAGWKGLHRPDNRLQARVCFLLAFVCAGLCAVVTFTPNHNLRLVWQVLVQLALIAVGLGIVAGLLALVARRIPGNGHPLLARLVVATALINLLGTWILRP